MSGNENTSAILAIDVADQWLADHKVSDSWRVINMLRDALVRSLEGGVK